MGDSFSRVVTSIVGFSSRTSVMGKEGLVRTLRVGRVHPTKVLTVLEVIIIPTRKEDKEDGTDSGSSRTVTVEYRGSITFVAVRGR